MKQDRQPSKIHLSVEALGRIAAQTLIEKAFVAANMIYDSLREV